MAFKYNKQVSLSEDGVYGPNTVGHKYRPAPYHGVNARRRADKSRWAYPTSAEYHVFNLADEHQEEMDENGIKDIRWMNDNDSGLFSMVDDCSEILGKDEERLAFFPKPMNEADPWHGYPVDSSDLGENLIEYWHNKELISNTTYLRLMRHKI